MSETDRDRMNIHVGGDVSGQLIAGDHNTAKWTQVSTPVTEQDLTSLQALFDKLRAQVDSDGGDQTAAARDKLDELAEAIMAKEPDLATMEHVSGWFKRRLPSLARSVSTLVVHPIVAKLVAVAGDDLAQEFSRRFS